VDASLYILYSPLSISYDIDGLKRANEINTAYPIGSRLKEQKELISSYKFSPLHFVQSLYLVVLCIGELWMLMFTVSLKEKTKQKNKNVFGLYCICIQNLA
jgi:hypothetical protein